ncbi:MAG TPA: GNAT family N-acetyltransferase [Gemmatimonadales bacterium]|nr:GNAT family N-acetyltransferase [Gemmatimonadales bacterium]
MTAPWTEAAVHLVLTPADAPVARALMAELDAEVAERDPGAPIHGLHPGEHRDPRLRFFVLTAGGITVGCGAIRVLAPDTAELKRMFVRRPFRGRGLSQSLLRGLEDRARASGIRFLRLETGPRQVEALALYRSAGYRGIATYGEYVDNPESICMEKVLAAEEGA